MENASEALMMAFGVLIFVLALTVAMNSFNQVKSTSDVVLYRDDETNYYDYQGATGAASQNRIVGLETIIPTLYKYYKELLEVMKVFHDYDVLAHLDLVSRYDAKGPIDLKEIRDILAEILTTVIRNGKGIELNTSSWHYGLGDTTPSRDILKLYHDLGGRIITVGSDAHKPDYLGDHFQDAADILKEIGFTEYCTFEKHQPDFHAL